MKLIAGIFALGFSALAFGLGLGSIALSVYGLILAFKASVLLGVIVLIVEPSPFVIGIVAVFGNPNVAHQLATWLGV